MKMNLSVTSLVLIFLMVAGCAPAKLDPKILEITRAHIEVTQDGEVLNITKNGVKVVVVKLVLNAGSVQIIDGGDIICSAGWTYGQGGICGFYKKDDPDDPPDGGISEAPVKPSDAAR
jgi:hypothetical protein